MFLHARRIYFCNIPGLQFFKVNICITSILACPRSTHVLCTWGYGKQEYTIDLLDSVYNFVTDGNKC